MSSAAHLKDWEIKVDRQGVEKLAIGMTDNPFQDTESTNFGFGFTNSSTGGCGKANINLMAKSASYIAGLDLLPDDRLLIRLQCGDEGGLQNRYVGVLRKVDTAYGTDPQVRLLEATGIYGQFRKVPLLLFYDAKTVIQIVQGVIADLSTKTDITNYSTYIDYGSYEIAQTDFLDHYADKAIKRLSEIAGPDCIFGVVPGASVSPTDARFYFKQLSDTAVDPGFEVEDTIDDAKGYITRDRHLNGMLVSCQRKISGGDLVLYIPPAEGTIPHRVRTERIPEIVAPTDAYEWATAKLQGIPINDEHISFKVPGFGKQVWANEIMNAPLSVLLEPGGTPVEIKCREYTLNVDENGSVDSDFVIGSLPDMRLANLFGDLYRETIVAKAREFWSGAELAARDSSVIREYRRTAAQDFGIRNFWATNLDNIESVMDNETWASGAYEVPATFNPYNWEYESDFQRVKGASGGAGCMVCVPIPTGLTAGAAVVFLNAGGASYFSTNEDDWSIWTNPAPDNPWLWVYDGAGVRVAHYITPTNAWRGQATLWTKLTSGVSEQPLEILLGYCYPMSSTANPTTYGGMKTLSKSMNILFAVNGRDPASSDAYCLRAHRKSGESAGIVRVALGWISGTTFHSDWWDAGATPDATAAGSVDLVDADGTTNRWTLDVWLPTIGGSGTYRVQIRKRDSGTVLWDSADVHGDGEVSASAPNPAGRYIAGTKSLAGHPSTSDHYSFGIVEVHTRSSGDLPIAVSRNGDYWTEGEPGNLLTLFGDTYLNGKRQLMFAVNLGTGQSVKTWAVGFTHETGSVSLEWDDNFGDEGTGDGLFKQPRDCTVDADYIYMTDYNNHRVQLLTNTDPPVYFDQFGSEGSGDGEFDHPWGIDHDDNYLYIADSSNKRVKVHLKTDPYTFIRSIGLGQLPQSIKGVTVPGRTYDGDDFVYVTCVDKYVWVFKKSGTYVDKFRPFSDLSTENPEDVKLSDDEQHLYITNPGGSLTDDPSNCIRKVKRTSPYTEIWSWGQRGWDPPNGKWEWPWAVCRLGDLLVVSSGSNAVYPAQNFLTVLADRGTYAKYMTHVDGQGGESGAGFLQPYAGDIYDNIIFVCELGYCQLKRFVLS